MTGWLDLLLVTLVLTNLALASTSRIAMCIRSVALQGLLLGIFPLLVHVNDLTLRIGLIAAGSVVIKGIALPILLSRTLHEANIRREVEPIVGFMASSVISVLSLSGSFWISARLPVLEPVASRFIVPVAFFTILNGLFLIVSRRKAVTQALGYLVMENGIYVFGVALVHEVPFIVELGILLDVFVAVFVMGITIFHINREFDHFDADRLTMLKDWTP
jgi:hydrogenase-4 component E